MKTNLLTILFLLACFSYANAGSYTITTYRWRNDDGTEITATWKANENTPITISDDSNIRVRFVMVKTSNDGIADGAAIQYSASADPTIATDWVSIFKDSDTDFVLALSDNVADAEPTTQQLGAETFTAGQVIEESPGAIIDWPPGSPIETEHEYVIKPSNSIKNTTYFFRSGVSRVYNVYPSLTYTGPVLSLQDNTLSKDAYYYTNPVINELKVEGSFELDNLKIYSISGSLIKQSSKNTVDTSDLNSGIYLVKMRTSKDKNATFKIIKK